MRFLLLTLSLFVLPMLDASAQVTVEVVLDEPEFLRDESMFVKVRISNRSGQALKLGQAEDWLTFNVQGLDGHTVEKHSTPPVAGEFSVESAQAATKTVNLMPHFGFAQPGRYTVSASVRVPQWNDDFISPAKTFHIIRGARVWEQEFGVPRKEGPPQMRLYSLVRATGMKQTRLYARVTDPGDNHVYRVVPLGPVVAFGKPEAQVDRLSQLHVLLQNGPRSFSYVALDPDGEWVARQTFDYADTRPVLRVNDAGRVLVAGGLRRFSATDIPPNTPGADRESISTSNPPSALTPILVTPKNGTSPPP